MCLEAGLEDPRPGVLGRSGVTAVLLCKPSCSEMNKMKNSLLLQGEINFSVLRQMGSCHLNQLWSFNPSLSIVVKPYKNN